MSENEYVVQCSACQTRFAVDASALQGSQKPKFHCSRCDNVFDAEWQALSRSPSATEATDAETGRLAIVRRNHTERRKIRSSPEVLAGGVPKDPTPPHETPADASPIVTAQEKPAQEVPGSDQTVQWPEDPKSWNDPSEPHRHASRKRRPTSDELQQLAFNFTSRPESRSRHTSSFSNEEREGLISGAAPDSANEVNRAEAEATGSFPADFEQTGFSSNTVPPDAPERDPTITQTNDYLETPLRPGSPSRDYTDYFKTPPESESDFSANTIQLGDRSNDFRDLFQPQTPQHGPSSLAREYRGPRSVALFAIPIVCVIALLFAFAATLKSSKSLEDRFTRALFPNIDRPAPSGVRIESPKLTRLQLDSGEQIILVSAKLVNGSEQLLRNAVVEVVAFDGEQRPIATTRVTVGNSLTKAVIKSLSPEIIKQLQNEPKPRQSSSVSVGKDREFIIALNDGKQAAALNKLASYTVRVSSVVL